MKTNKKKTPHIDIQDLARKIGVSDGREHQMMDDTFMAECWRRTNDSGKCDLCELRFKCFTEEWGEKPKPSIPSLAEELRQRPPSLGYA